MKDLIIGDGLKEELVQSRKVIEALKSKSTTQDSISSNLRLQLQNVNLILQQKDAQMSVHQKMTKDLQVALKKEQFKNKIFSFGAPILIIGALLLK